MSIYTKNGDSGYSSLYNNKHLKKDNPVFEVIGTFDELNSILGFVHVSRNKLIKKYILDIQNNLFEIGSFVAGKEFTDDNRKSWESKIVEIETIIDEIDAKNTPLRKFVLPGGSVLSSQLHLARAVCRRAERCFVELNKGDNSPMTTAVGKYLNRLSDLLFVLARYNNKILGVKDILWSKT